MQTPLINCVFINEDLILINFFDQRDLTNYHLIYDHISHLVSYEKRKTVLPNSFMHNFPLKIFYEMKSQEN